MKTKSQTSTAATQRRPAIKSPTLHHSTAPRLSAFNPALPEDGALIIAEVLRGQFNGLDADIQSRATQAELAAAEASLQTQIDDRATHLQVNEAMTQAESNAVAAVLPQTPNNCNGVSQLYQQAQSTYDQYQMQAVIDKMNELIAALYRMP